MECNKNLQYLITAMFTGAVHVTDFIIKTFCSNGAAVVSTEVGQWFCHTTDHPITKIGELFPFVQFLTYHSLDLFIAR